MFVTLGLALLFLFVLNLLVSGLLLHLTARLLRVEGARFSRALLIVALSALTQLIAWFAVTSVNVERWLGVRLPVILPGLDSLAVVAIATLLVSLFATVGLLGGRANGTGKLLAVWLLWGLGANVYGVGLYFALKTQAEGFIVPTGAMADTILGHSKEVSCPECGHPFRVNDSGEQEAGERERALFHLSGAICPNCRFNAAFPPFGGPAASDPERILVVKNLLQSITAGPSERFDVIVFQYTPRPFEQTPSPINYVKRLVGRGGETVGIYYGDLYLLEGEQPDPAGAKPAEGRDDPEKWMRVDARRELLESRKGEPRFQILRRRPERVLAMRHLVYDNDHPAKDLEGKSPPRWAGREGAGWTADGRGFKHTAKDDTLSWLGYQHILRTAQDGKPQLITDFIGYNAYESVHHRADQTGRNWVGDLMLDFDARAESGSGELVIELARGVDRFRASFDLSSGTCSLRRLGEKEEELDRKPTAVKGPGSWRLRFANVDDRLTLWVDGSLPFGDGVAYAAPKQLGPTRNDLSPALIGVRGGAVRVSGLKLWRDTYWTIDPTRGGDAGVNTPSWDDPEAWEPLQRLPGRTFYVQPGHYFCLGDNSPESSDSRYWGLVPERLVLGRAVMVYYPFSRARLIE